MDRNIALPFPCPVAVEKPKPVIDRNVKEMVASGFAPDMAKGAQDANRIERRFPSGFTVSKPVNRSKALTNEE